jgi:carbon monoxide dehydrogenase subunit G
VPIVEREVSIAARPEVVWEVIADPHYIPKLYPDMLSIHFEPHTQVVVGQKRTLNGKIGKRMIEFKTEVSEVVPLKRLVIVGRRGGAFERYHQLVELTPSDAGTLIRTKFDFKISEAYFGPEFYIPVLEQAAIENQEVFLLKIKEMAELEPTGAPQR